jgi:hypothetical protein
LAELLNELAERYTWLVPFGSDGLLQVEGIFQVFEELGDDLIGQLVYELFGAFLESTHDSIISVGAGAGQLPGPPDLTRPPSIVYSIAVIYIDHNQTTLKRRKI